MSIMCSLNGKCGPARGLCGHEKMMTLIAMVSGLAAVGHWGLNWF